MVPSRALRAPAVPQLGQSIFSPPPNKLIKKSSNPISASTNSELLKGTVVQTNLRFSG
jgi:hypothetical protein